MCIAQLPCTSQQGLPETAASSKQFIVLALKALSTSRQLYSAQGLLSVLEVSNMQQGSQSSLRSVLSTSHEECYLLSLKQRRAASQTWTALQYLTALSHGSM